MRRRYCQGPHFQDCSASDGLFHQLAAKDVPWPLAIDPSWIITLTDSGLALGRHMHTIINGIRLTLEASAVLEGRPMERQARQGDILPM